MRTAQLALLLAFAVCAALTALLQVRYGMIAGRSEASDPQSDPKAVACRRRAGACAVAAAVCLVLCIALGAVSRAAL